METSEVFDTVLKKCTEIEQQVIDSVLERFTAWRGWGLKSTIAQIITNVN